MSEIIYVCKSVNNKNVREGELKILRKSNSNELCFEFGENEMNLKKRFYDNEKDFEYDFNELTKLKTKSDENSTKRIVVEEEMAEENLDGKDKKSKGNLF